MMLSKVLSEKCRKIKLVIFDVDGVMTDGCLHFDADGNLAKIFHVHDGLGIKLLQRTGVKVAVISGCSSKAIQTRMSRLKVDHVFLNAEDKLPILTQLLQELSITLEQTLVVGDDWPDVPMMKRAGVSVTVPNARPEVLKMADITTQSQGGMGAVREVCEMIMECQQTLTEASLDYELN